MLKLKLAGDKASWKVLALGSHPDDIEIGCGGTILRLAEAFPELEVCWVVLSGREERAAEARRSADDFLQGAAKTNVVMGDFRDGFFPYAGGEIKDFFETLPDKIAPDLIFTHQRADLHQDHRLVSELTWNTFRDHLILEYEVPKYDGDLGSPNFFLHLSGEICRLKVEKLLSNFTSQRGRGWFTEDLFFSALRLRGVESNSPTRYAEAFYCRKVVL